MTEPLAASTANWPDPPGPGGRMPPAEALAWLGERSPERLIELRKRAEAVRHAAVGDSVWLRGLIHLSNVCRRECAYCGLRVGTPGLVRYRMTTNEILACARQAVAYGLGTVVLQAGEDPALTGPLVCDLVRRIKAETGLAVTLSLGERAPRDLHTWRLAGADRYLLKFETSDRALLKRLRAAPSSGSPDRVELLGILRRLGYEIGSGILVGLPGQTPATLIADLALSQSLDVDMLAIGPWLPHPGTPLGAAFPEGSPTGRDQIGADPVTIGSLLCLARLACPEAHIPATTATRQSARGDMELALSSGADVIMIDLTPPPYREAYDVYPDPHRSSPPPVQLAEILDLLTRAGRPVGSGPDGRRRRPPTGISTPACSNRHYR